MKFDFTIEIEPENEEVDLSCEAVDKLDSLVILDQDDHKWIEEQIKRKFRRIIENKINEIFEEYLKRDIENYLYESIREQAKNIIKESDMNDFVKDRGREVAVKLVKEMVEDVGKEIKDKL